MKSNGIIRNPLVAQVRGGSHTKHDDTDGQVHVVVRYVLYRRNLVNRIKTGRHDFVGFSQSLAVDLNAPCVESFCSLESHCLAISCIAYEKTPVIPCPR